MLEFFTIKKKKTIHLVKKQYENNFMVTVKNKIIKTELSVPTH